jgi:hypothetical protein
VVAWGGVRSLLQVAWIVAISVGGSACRSNGPSETPATQPERNAFAERSLAPEYIASIAWKDLLASSAAWQTAGFPRWGIANGVLSADHLDTDAKFTAIMSVGDAEQWRDFVVELDALGVRDDLLPPANHVELHIRLGKKVDSATLNLPFPSAASAEAGTVHHIVISALGDMVTTRVDGTETTEKVHPSRVRGGAIGISVPPGGSIEIRRMRIRVLD